MTQDNQNLLSRRVAKVLPSKETLQKLLDSGKKIKLYQGFDPTANRLHLGHTIGLRKLMDFANAGHNVIFLFGTGTVLVGDPSQRDSGRKLITQEEIDKNIQTWKSQVEPIVDFNKINILQNGDWLTRLTIKDIVNIGSNISAVQLFKRQSFTRRIEKGDTVWFHETMYPLLQGYDSVHMDVDLEIGGTDQEFNMLVGRELMKKMKGKEKFVLTTPMINGTDGQQMSKTTGNCVWLDDSPGDMYGKLMSIPDNQIRPYLENLTDIPLQNLSSLPNDPLANKKLLSLNITAQFHGQQKAQAAADNFKTTVQDKSAPESIPEFTPTISSGETLFALIKESGLGDSNGHIKRMIEQGGVTINNQKITDPNQSVDFKDGDIIKFGKREFRKIKLK